jgi:AcrR family transcriptional regulator
LTQFEPASTFVAPLTPDTKEQLISVAERLFAERGFAGTTLRNVVSEAGANLAAVHYHFGSKEELYRAVVSRFARPIVEQELALLQQLQAETAVPSVEDILTAMLRPNLEMLVQDESILLIRAQFMGRCRTEPEPIQSIAAAEFAIAIETYLDALQRALPHQSRSQLAWKLDLVIAALIRVQTEAGKPFALLQGTTPRDVHQAVNHLVTFLAAGMRS